MDLDLYSGVMHPNLLNLKRVRVGGGEVKIFWWGFPITLSNKIILRGFLEVLKSDNFGIQMFFIQKFRSVTIYIRTILFFFSFF